MMPAVPVKASDPAGLDNVILAAGQGVTRWLESLIASKLGRPVNLWDGPNGLGAVLREHIEAAGVPNKRFPELVTPRSVLSPIIGARPKRRLRKGGR